MLLYLPRLMRVWVLRLAYSNLAATHCDLTASVNVFRFQR